MHQSLLASKLRVPESRPSAVPRARLVDRLDEGLMRDGVFARRLSLISAPAGFGKTTTAALWARRRAAAEPKLRVAWLSLDEGERDPAVFARHLRSALRAAAPALAEPPDAGDGSSPPEDCGTLMTELLNELADVEEALILVLDDYHSAACPEVDRAVALLVDHLPPRMHVAIATRAEPDLPVARLRARGQLEELRAEDLRFDGAEAADFLERSMRLSLSAREVAALELRTEGWAAGLQLAALALRGREDAAAFVASFAGSHRFVLDYLVDEVLSGLPEAWRDFLLRTSVLDQFCASLCEAVAGGDGRDMLDSLERANLFLVPLDERRGWYRYHQLFSEALRSRLGAERAPELRGLHGRAGAWYAREGFPDEAIRHALAGEDFELAADLIERRWLAMDGEFRAAAWLGWARQLPEREVRARPVLSAGFGWALLDTGELEASEERFRDAENPPEGFVVADREEYLSLRSSIATARAYRALALGDIGATIEQARRAIELAPPGDARRRGAASALLGLARYAEGDLAGAEEALAEGMAIARAAGRLQEELSMLFPLAEVRLALGRLREAERAYEDSLRRAAGQGKGRLQAAAELHRGLGEILLERGELDAAERELGLGRDIGEIAPMTGWRCRACAAEARLAEARGDFGGALELLAEAESHRLRTPLPEARPIEAARARIRIKRGDFAGAISDARALGLSAEGEPRFLDEYWLATLARAMIARYAADGDAAVIGSAVRLLERLLGAALDGGRRGSAVGILALLALAREARGERSAALDSLQRALELAEPEGFALEFLGEGAAMTGMLEELRRKAARPSIRSYAERLLALDPLGAGKPRSAIAPTAARRALREELSDREREVLRLLRGDLSGPEIARELYISLNTFRTHTKNIFDKLDVNSRRAAVRRAEELGL